MIGVLSKPSETGAVTEFFQLFKTPWEFCCPGKPYEVVIATTEEIPRDLIARLLVIYSAHTIQFDRRIGVVIESQTTRAQVDWQGIEFPIYGDMAEFRTPGPSFMTCNGTSSTTGTIIAGKHQTIVRIGLDLFYEVDFLLSEGQPAENARVPTLDIHISVLRSIMIASGVSFVEVPPAPAGYDFMACLTHDVDFVGVRDHCFDHTMWGFLYRSLVGSTLRTLKGTLPWSKCLRNWAAALSLPLVYLGLRDDFWLEFDKYLEIEKDLGSTFYFLPFKNFPGTLGAKPAPKRRAAKYDVVGIKDQVLELTNRGCEVGLHGIDAWQNSNRGRTELQRLQEITGHAPIGTRMHWLYWNETSPKALEDAGFTYDSTFGYNDAVGFRAGTTQPFCPRGVDRLLELPLTIQDTAMFYVDRMTLSEAEALNACRELIRAALSSGGILTVNWHTRSLSPERLWGDFYAELLNEMKTRRVWFGTAQELVSWFQRRRMIRFDSLQPSEVGMRVAVSSPSGHSERLFTIRKYQPSSTSDAVLPRLTSAFTDERWSGEGCQEVLLESAASTFA